MVPRGAFSKRKDGFLRKSKAPSKPSLALSNEGWFALKVTVSYIA